MTVTIGRRELLAALGGAAAAWPLAARAQQGERMRRVGVLMGGAGNDPVEQARLAAFLDGLHQLGWSDGRNVQIDTRWPAGSDVDQVRKYAAELVALTPDVIMASTSVSVSALLQAGCTVPIVFASVTDPVGQGFVASLERPGGNVTGFSLYEYGTSTKWLELLKEITPSITRVAVIRDPTVPFTNGQLGAIQSVAPSFRVEVRPLGASGALGLLFGEIAFEVFDLESLLTDVEPQSPEHAHVEVRDPHAREARDDVAAPVRVDELEARHDEREHRDPVAEAVLAREEIEELPLPQGPADLAVADAEVARLAKDLAAVVGDVVAHHAARLVRRVCAAGWESLGSCGYAPAICRPMAASS